MKLSLLFILLSVIATAFLSCNTPTEEDKATPTLSPTWEFENTPVWADEFDYEGKPDPSRWEYDTGGDGWGNNELEYYTDSIRNARVADGLLTITARREPTQDNEYSSARLVSKGKGDFLYGRIEAKAKLPSGRGTWPAIWMLPSESAYGPWPKSGEIDIMEHVGYDQNRVHITVHTEAYNHVLNTQVGQDTLIDNASTTFNRYRVDWTPDYIQGFINDALVFDFPNEETGPATWPFDQKFHLLLNIAVGGNWGGLRGADNNVFPAEMQVDYVRVYPLKRGGKGEG